MGESPRLGWLLLLLSVASPFMRTNRRVDDLHSTSCSRSLSTPTTERDVPPPPLTRSSRRRFCVWMRRSVPEKFAFSMNGRKWLYLCCGIGKRAKKTRRQEVAMPFNIHPLLYPLYTRIVQCKAGQGERRRERFEIRH